MKFVYGDLQKVQLAKAIQQFAFWIPIAFLYYQAQGYTDSQIFSLLSALQLYMVVLEYPTGVVGDVYGHKLSVLLGYLFGGISFLIMGSSLNIPYTVVHVILLLFAAASSFISGSDIALLHSVSKDFKSDIAKTNQFAGWVQSLGLVIGGFLGAIDLRLPFLLTGVAFLISFFILISVKTKAKEKKNELSVFQTAILGMKESLFNMKIFYPIFLSSVILMYLISEKWVLPEVFSRSNIPVAFFGVATAVVYLARGQASAIYRKIGEKPYWLLFIGLVLSSLFISIPYFSIIGLLFVYGFAAFITTQTDVTINEEVDGRARASVVSFRNLLVRLLNSPYLWILGIASLKLEFPGVNLVMSSVLVAFVIIVTLLFKLMQHYNVRRK